jgi:hypothetical protein
MACVLARRGTDLRAVAVLLALLASTPAWAQSALPDLARTPGAINPEVTVFDRAFQQRWMRIKSEDEISLVNPRLRHPR